MQDPEDRSFASFAAAFALALVAHQLWWRGLPTSDLHGLVIVLAVAVLVAPASRTRFTALALAEVVAVVNDLPTVGDHTLLAAVTAAAFLAGGRRWSTLAPFLRAQAVLLYGAAAFAKLNLGFLDAASSCANGQVTALLGGDGAAWAVGPAIPATVAAEATLALLLAVPRTRTAGVVFGLAFHAVLALAGNVPFAAYALVLYAAFATPQTVRVPQPWAVAVGATGLWVLTASADPETLRDVLRLLTAAGLLALAVRRTVPVTARRRGLAPAYAAAFGLLVLNAASPYLGLKTEASFTMFSNLQTEPGHWNHVVVPERVRVFGLQDDLVRLTSSNAAALERRRRAGALMVRRELERFLRENPRARATYVDARDPSRRLPTQEPSPVLDRLLNFYDVREGARGRC